MHFCVNARLKATLPRVCSVVKAAFLCTLRKAVVRKIDGEPFFSLSFVYSSPLMKEQFNFVRHQKEKLKTICDIIKDNIKRKGERKIGILSSKISSPSEIKDLEESLKEVDSVTVYLSGNKINDEVENKVAFQSGAVLKIGNAEFTIVINPPTVVKLSLPNQIMAGFVICPYVKLEFANILTSAFAWFRSNGHQERAAADMVNVKWEKVGDQYFYSTQDDDVDRYLKIRCTPLGDGQIGQSVEEVSTLVRRGPGPCPFEKRHQFTKNPTEPGRFRIMSYNILADLYAETNFSLKELFRNCPPHALKMDYRKQLLLKEITGYNSDVICLQEVDVKFFLHMLKPSLTLLNYEGSLMPKPDNPEGLACFYNKKKFSFIREHNIILSKVLKTDAVFTDFLEAISENSALKTNVLKRNTVLQVIVLKSLEVPNRKLCIANVHLYSKRQWDNIRLLHSGMCMRHLKRVINFEKTQDPDCSVAVVFSGDFNSTPKDGVYEYITKRIISSDHSDWKCVPEQAIENFGLTHSFSLISACGTPPFTNFVTDYQDCLDYIFADEFLLKVEEVVPLPSYEEVNQYLGLPSITMPSDHIALVCTLKWL